MTKIHVLTVALALCLAGCASPVHMTTQQTRLAAQLNQAQAEQIIEKIFAQTDEQSGLLSSNGSLHISRPKILKIESGVVYFADYTSTLTFDLWRYRMLREEQGSSLFKFDMRELESIRIVNRKAINQELLRSTDGVQFALQGSNKTFINLDVKKEYADEVIAVAKYYAPHAL